jgi:hypothetical protein
MRWRPVFFDGRCHPVFWYGFIAGYAACLVTFAIAVLAGGRIGGLTTATPRSIEVEAARQVEAARDQRQQKNGR